MVPEHDHFMRIALELSRKAAADGNRPVGSIVVKDGTIVEANIPRVVLGGRQVGIGRKDLGGYSVEALLKLTGRPLELVTGVRARECEEFRLAWIAERAAQGLGPR